MTQTYLFGIHVPHFFNGEPALLNFPNYFRRESVELSHGTVEAPQLQLHHLGHVEKSTGQQGPVLMEHNFK